MGEIRVKTADGWQALPSHQKTSTGWKDIPTHTMTATGWQGELTSQSPLEFRATGQSLLDWRIDGASGGVGDWDETEQKYVIPVNVRGRNLLNSDKQTQGDGFLNNTACVLYNNEETFTGTEAFWITEYIKIKPNTLYYYYQNLLRSSAGCMTFYDENKTQLSGHVLQTSVMTESTTYTLSTFRTPQNAAYMRMNIDNNSSINCLYSDEVASYEPYINTTTSLYTTAQLMDGDSLNYTTDQTTIPITQGENTLTVLTQVQPKSVFVKFEG